MKFNIKHTTRLFYRGIVLPWFIFIAVLLLFLALGFDVSYKIPTMIFIGITVLCVVAELIFVILYGIEGFFGAKIIVESDHIYVKMLLRRKKLHFDDIADAKFSHYEESTSYHYRPYPSHHKFYRHGTSICSKLDFYLSSGKIFSLNDDAKGYAKKRNQWTVAPNLDPNKDIQLYQAYRCYLAAARRYYNQQQKEDI